jgi:hypothetical protein
MTPIQIHRGYSHRVKVFLGVEIVDDQVISTAISTTFQPFDRIRGNQLTTFGTLKETVCYTQMYRIQVDPDDSIEIKLIA